MIASCRKHRFLFKAFVKRWKIVCCVIIVQRAVRIWLSKVRVQNRCKLLKNIKDHRLKVFRHNPEKRMFGWKTFVFQVWRNRHRACNKLIKLFRYLRTRSRMRRLMDRKKKVCAFVCVLCRGFLRRCFHKLHCATINRHAFVRLYPYMATWLRFTSLCTFKRWKIASNEKYILSIMLRIRDKYEIEIYHWVASTNSIR